MEEHFPRSAGILLDDHGTAVLIEIDSALYPDDLVLKAAYWLTDQCYIHVGHSPEGKLVVEIRAKDGGDGPALISVCGEFCNKLIDFALRARVSAETSVIQEALLHRAFVSLIPKPIV